MSEWLQKCPFERINNIVRPYGINNRKTIAKINKCEWQKWSWFANVLNANFENIGKHISEYVNFVNICKHISELWNLPNKTIIIILKAIMLIHYFMLR